MPLNSCFYSSPPSVSLPFFRGQHDVLLCEDEYVQQAFPSLSLALLPGRLQPVLLCLSLRLYQPITSWLQVLNLGPSHQLAHYSTALNLPFSYSLPLSLFSSSPSTLLHAIRYLLSLVLADLNNSIVPAVPEGSDDTNKPRFEIDFHSAPF